MHLFTYATIILSFCFMGSFNATAAAQTPDAIVSSFFQTLQPATGALQKANQSKLPSRELTPMLIFAQNNWSALSAKTQATVSPWFARPTDPNAQPPKAGFNFYQTGQVISTLATTNFLFHYLDDATYTTDANKASTAFVQQLAIEAEKVWTQEITTMGYNVPPSDGTLGGNTKYDIYLINVGSARLYGYVTSDATVTSGPFPNSVYSHMVLDNDFAKSQFGYTNPITPGQVTLAHEFFHSIQFGYDFSEFPAFNEQLSTWMEDKVYPTIKDNLQYIGEKFTDTNGNGQYDTGEPFVDRNNSGIRSFGSQDYPELELDSFGQSKSGVEQYGRFLWVRYLSDKFNDAVVLDTLTACGQTAGNNTYAATDAVLAGKYTSSLSQAFHEYNLWMMDVSLYTNGADYPITWGDNLFNNGAINISSNASVALQPFSGKQKHLSSVYELVNAPSGTYTFTATAGNPALTAMLQMTTNGAYTNQAITLTGGTGAWSAPIGANKVTFAISNTSPTDDTMTWQLTDGKTAPMPTLSGGNTLTPIGGGNSGFVSGGGGGGGCLTQTLTPLSSIWILMFMLPFFISVRSKTKTHKDGLS